MNSTNVTRMKIILADCFVPDPLHPKIRLLKLAYAGKGMTRVSCALQDLSMCKKRKVVSH
jgi:hypothetical protein